MSLLGQHVMKMDLPASTRSDREKERDGSQLVSSNRTTLIPFLLPDFEKMYHQYGPMKMTTNNGSSRGYVIYNTAIPPFKMTQIPSVMGKALEALVDFCVISEPEPRMQSS